MPKYQVIVYTDGSSLGNPGAGGWASIMKIVDLDTKETVKDKELTGGRVHATNQEMELKAVLETLKSIKNPVTGGIHIVSDSRYVLNGCKDWIWSWSKKGWRKSDGDTPKNIDLWKGVYREVIRLGRENLYFRWVKAHSGNPQNEAADALAQKTARSFQSQGELPLEKDS